MLRRTLLALLPALGFGCSASQGPMISEEDRANTIMGVLSSDGRFEELVALLEKTGLDEDLVHDGPFTLFAPVDAAFEDLESELLQSASQTKNRDRLARALEHHLVDHRIDADTVRTMSSISTLTGERVGVLKKDERIVVGNAVVIDPDIEASNGIIHAIDHVLPPPKRAEDEVKGDTTGMKGGPDAWWW